MNIEKILNFVMTHNTLMIEVLIGVILVLTLLVAIRTFLSAKEEEANPQAGMNLADLEATLKKLLEKANAVPATGSASADGASPEVSNLIAEINNLKLELDQKRKEIEDVKTAAANAPAGATAAPAGAATMSDEERAKLEAKLKELEGKLAEYEIISEDIADLSFYKEQNTKLQKELESLKAGGAPVAAETPAQAPVAEAPKAEEKKSEPEIVEKAQAAPAEVPAPAPAPAPTPQPAPEPVAPPAPPAPAAEAAPAAPAPAAPAPTAAPAPPAPESAAETSAAPAKTPPEPVNVVDDSLMAEFAAAIESQKADAPAVEPSSEGTAEPAVPAGELGTVEMV
ncbi:MAG: hypothetical protein ACK5RO_05800 [Pseudobdellovibrionaceae bacterium]